MNSIPILEQVAELLEQLPGTWPVTLAAQHLVDGYNAHVRSLQVYLDDGRIGPAGYDRLLARHRSALLTQLQRLAGQAAAEGGVQ